MNYKLIYQDKNMNTLKEIIIEAKTLREAQRIAKHELATTNNVDVKTIKTQRLNNNLTSKI
jgi:hypothetical protein